MGFFDLFFGKGGGGSRTLEDNIGDDDSHGKKTSGNPLDALLGTGKYGKTEEQKQNEKEKKTLYRRFENIKLKKYDREMNYRYNDNKKRIEVGEGFELRQLPGIIYSLSKASTIFRKDIGGRFDRVDREEMERAIRKRRATVKWMNKKLFHNARGERQQQVEIRRLFGP